MTRRTSRPVNTANIDAPAPIFPLSARPDFIAVPPGPMSAETKARCRAALNINVFAEALVALAIASPTIADICHNRLPAPPSSHATASGSPLYHVLVGEGLGVGEAV